MTNSSNPRVVEMLAWVEARLARARRGLHEQRDQVEALEAELAARTAVEVENTARRSITGRAHLLKSLRACRARKP